MATQADIAKRFEALQTIKEDLKDARQALKDECMGTADYEKMHEDKQEIVGRMRLIELEVKERSGLGQRIKELNDERKIIEDIITQEALELIQEGQSEEIPFGMGQVLIPRIKVTYKAQQLSMGF